LAKQYEISKIDEAKNAAIIQVLDKAIEPDRKSKPKRALIIILATLAGGFVGVLLAYIREAMDKVRKSPRQVERVATLRRYMAWR
jgi:uncharacterized protein involved in exopolysaccharide biosynthesis